MTAACWDTGGFMNTAAVHVTVQGTVTPTPVTAFLGESQDFNATSICIGALIKCHTV